MSTAASQKTPPPPPPRYRDDPFTREVLRGLVLMSPRPSLRHALCTGQLHMVLAWHFGRRRGTGGPGRTENRWWILPEPELHLEDEDPIVPDLAGWRQSRMAIVPADNATKVPPDWVCVVLSPGTEPRDRSTKMAIYADALVNHVWLLDPLKQYLEIHELVSYRQYRQLAIYSGADVAHAVPFEELALELDEIWPALAV